MQHLPQILPQPRQHGQGRRIHFAAQQAQAVNRAARVYFGRDANHLGCGVKEKPCAAELTAPEAALLTAVIANPTAFDPVAHPEAAVTRRNIVLGKMRDQGRISATEYDQAVAEGLPALVVPPSVDTRPCPNIKQRNIDGVSSVGQSAFKSPKTSKTFFL